MAILGIEPIDAGVADPRAYGSKPLLIFDIDGVLNRIPFEEVYIGPECDHDPRYYWQAGGCEHRRNMDNWEIRRWKLDPDFFDDVPEGVHDGLRVHREWQTMLWVSEELRAELKRLEDSGKVDIIFLSMWRENSRYLNGLMGTHFPYLEIPQRFSESETGAKHRALFSFLRKVHRNHGSIPPFSWTDDVVTADTFDGTIQQLVGKWLRANGINESANLIFHTEPEEGLKRSQWQQILDFVDHWAPLTA